MTAREKAKPKRRCCVWVNEREGQYRRRPLSGAVWSGSKQTGGEERRTHSMNRSTAAIETSFIALAVCKRVYLTDGNQTDANVAFKGHLLGMVRENKVTEISLKFIVNKQGTTISYFHIFSGHHSPLAF